MIQFDKRFRGAILDGTKTRTTRISTEQKWFEGEIHALIDGDGVICSARIRAVETEILADITDVEVSKEGFKTRSEYLRFMDHVYACPLPDREAWVIRFEVISDA